jgi:hypothetical protein
MYDIGVLRVNTKGGVTRGTIHARNQKELLRWIAIISNHPESLIEVKITTRTDDEEPIQKPELQR